MQYYQVIRSPNELEHHGILGMKWGVWNEETRARRMGSRRRQHKDYAKLSDKKLKREVERRRRVRELERYDKEDDLAKNPLNITKERMKMIAGVIASVSAVSAAVVVAKQKVPIAVNATGDIAEMVAAGNKYIKTLLRTPTASYETLKTLREMKWL